MRIRITADLSEERYKTLRATLRAYEALGMVKIVKLEVLEA